MLNMKYSKSGYDLTKKFEGCELVAYPDPGTKDHPDPKKRNKPWTIGWGHTKGVYEGTTCSQAQADAWLVEDMKEAEDAVNDLVKVPLSQGQFDALVDFTFNLGRSRLLNSELLQKLNEGRYSEVDGELMEWIYASGKILAGLVSRRRAEADSFDDFPPTST
jgi:lysozyme